MNSRRLASLGILVLVAAFAMPGCADQLTREHFDMLLVGHADEYDVEMTIGEPDEKIDEWWHYERVDKHLNVLIHFDEQCKVWRKEWHDTLNGVHYDTHEPEVDSSTYESTTIRTIVE